MDPRGLVLPSRIIGGCFLVFALIPASIGVWLYLRTNDFLSAATSVEGVVVELSGNGSTFHSVFEYADATGTVHRGKSSWSSNPPAHSVGEKIRVLYRTDDPSDVCIDGFTSLWLGPTICAVITFFPLVLSIILIWLVPFTIRRVWLKKSGAVGN